MFGLCENYEGGVVHSAVCKKHVFRREGCTEKTKRDRIKHAPLSTRLSVVLTYLSHCIVLSILICVSPGFDLAQYSETNK